MRTLLILVFLVFYQVSDAQLIDPFGKIITHEIKLNKLKDGTYAGAMEWTTGGIDSLQRFVINGLDVKTPVLVRIISKAPKHNIDLGFYKEKWDKLESKISTNGDKFSDKIFRTMSSAGLGVYSEVAGIPYLISVKTGLQFPSTKSLIRITDDKEEYSRHLRKMGYGGAIFEEGNFSNSNNSGDNNNLMYVIIGLLASIVLLLAIFLMKRKKPKNTVILLFVFCLAQFCMAQSSQPKSVPIDGQGNSPVFLEYQTSNVGNQVPIETVMNIGVADMVVAGDTTLERVLVRLDTAPGVEELTGKDAQAVLARIKEANEQFERDYGEASPGESTQGNQRTLPTDRTNEELNRLRNQVQQLQQQVALLSQEDEAFDDDSDIGDGGEILLYCEDFEDCQACVSQATHAFNVHVAYWNYLQHFYLKEVDDLNDKIEYGNTLASMPGFGIAWGPILTTVIRPAMNKLKAAYNQKFNAYIESIEADLEDISACYEGPNGRFLSNDTFEIQAYAIINSLKAARINK